MYSARTVDEAVNYFNFVMMEIINDLLPFKRIRMRINSAPWITNEYLSLIDNREYKAGQYRKCPCEHHLLEKKEAQRILQRMKNQLKQNYIAETLKRYKNDSKKLWRNLRTFWPSTKNKSSNIKSIQGHSDNFTKANILNDHFSKMGSRVLDDIATDVSIDDYQPDYNPPVFYINGTDDETIINCINQLSSSKSCGFYGLTSFLVKTYQNEITPILLYIFNESIRTKTFPALWKSG